MILYIDVPHFQKVAKIGVYIIFGIPHCTAEWNTNVDEILETGRNQGTWKRRFHTFKKYAK